MNRCATAGILGLGLGLSGCYSGFSSSIDDGAGSGLTAADDESGGGTDGTDSDDGGDSGEEGEADPGRVTIHRLNRAEYNNTMRDLFFGLDLSPADVFPADDHSFGFDNIADALNTTPLLVELYERAAEQVLDAAFAAPGGEAIRLEAEVAGGTVGAECCDGYWNLSSTGSVTFNVEAEADGTYEIVVRAAGQQAGPEAPNMLVSVDGAEATAFDVPSTVEAPGDHTLEVELTAGAHTVTTAFTNDFVDEATGGDRNLLVDYVDLVPVGGEGGVVDQLVLCAPDTDTTCTQSTLETFALRAWRRPATETELADLVGFVTAAEADGESWQDGLRLAMKATLLSPHFAFRVELDEDPNDLEPHMLGDYEIASRLSYFLWSSMPDAALFDAAAAGELTDKEVVATQVQRMLTDTKASALADNFAGQWLYTRALGEGLVKDPEYYPEFTTALREDLRTEMEMLIGAVLTEGRGVDELFTGKETFVNDRLAAYYGLPPVGTDAFVRVSLEGTPRKGLLTSGGLMSVLAHPNVTSPVKRGQWVLEQLLCIEPPPPPDDAETTVDPSFDDGPMRDRLAKHREDPTCAGCHELMDPIGLAFENYDGMGAWRTQEGPYDIDASGTLPTGGEFNDAVEMVGLIAQSDQFARCVTEKVLLYGLGRGIEEDDEELVDVTADVFAASGYNLESLVIELATSDAFLMRRGEPTQ